MMNPLFVRKKLEEFLLEDLGHIDFGVGDEPRYVVAEIVAEEPGVFCGGAFIAETFELLRTASIKPVEMLHILQEGSAFSAGETLARFRAEQEIVRHGIRTVLNLLRHLVSIATHVHQKDSALKGFPTKLLDTRKTTPGLRAFEKYAVRVGGGHNHRFGRFDGMIIKKEDIKLAGGVKPAIERAFHKKSHLVSVEVEVESLEELEEVLKDGRVRHILLDNMDLGVMREAVEKCGKTHILEASGIGDKTLRDVAATGVHYISMSSLILGAKPINIKMRIVG